MHNRASYCTVLSYRVVCIAAVVVEWVSAMMVSQCFPLLECECF